LSAFHNTLSPLNIHLPGAADVGRFLFLSSIDCCGFSRYLSFTMDLVSMGHGMLIYLLFVCGNIIGKMAL
jgi:hypothetical protein